MSSGSPKEGKPAPAVVPPKASAPTAPATAAVPVVKTLTSLQKTQLGSKFTDSTAERRRDNLLGLSSSTPGVRLADVVATDELIHEFDGTEPAAGLSQLDVWKAVTAPVQSREGQRSAERLRQVLHQFAVAHNPRYAEEAPGRPRGHLYVWDVSRAMGCEVPHFVGAKELTLAQTSDWVRHEGPMRGWKRTAEEDAFTLADQGLLVLAMPKDPKTRGLAVVTPEEPTGDKPLLAGAILIRAYASEPKALLGTRLLEYFHHA